MNNAAIIITAGNKEAQIRVNVDGEYRATIMQIVNSGLEVGKDFVMMKTGFSSYARAEKWALKNM